MNTATSSSRFPHALSHTAFAARLWCALLLAGATSGLAQTTAVSNLGQTTTENRAVANNITLGMQFTTGSSATTVSQFTLAFDAAHQSPSGLQLSLYSGFTAGVGPSGLLGAFTGADPVASGQHTFTGSAALNANSSYYLIASAPSAPAENYFLWRYTASTAEDAGSLAGWSIGNGLIVNNSSFTWAERPGTLQFSVQTAAIPEPSTYAAVAGMLTLCLALWRRRKLTT